MVWGEKNSERNIPTKPKPGGPISSMSSSIRARRPGRDWVVLTPNRRVFYWEAWGFWHSLWCLSWWSEKANQKEGIPGSQNQVSLFTLKTSRCLKANNPGTWWKWKPAHLLLAVKKKRKKETVESVEERGSYFIIYCPHSILATWRSR